MTGRVTFRKVDLARAVQVVRDAGLDARFEIDAQTGKISFTTTNSRGDEQVTDLDAWMKKHAHTA